MSTFNMAPIMEAFFEGVNLARRKKEWADQQEQAKLEFEQQKVRDKALDDYRKSSLEQDKRRIDLTAADQKAERARRAAEMYSAGELQLPGGVSGMQTPDIRSALLGNVLQGMNLPEIPGSGDLQVPGTEDEFVSASQLPSAGNRPIDIRNQWQQQQQLYNQQRLDQAMQIAQAQIQSREREGAANRANRLQAKQLGASGKGSKSDLTPYQRIQSITALANKAATNKYAEDFRKINRAWELVRGSVRDPKAPGISDLNFVFQYNKVLDPESTVREGEVENLKKIALSYAQRFGYNIRGIAENKPFISPEARAAMKAEIFRMRQLTAENLRKSNLSFYNLAKEVDPEITPEKFMMFVPNTSSGQIRREDE